MNTDYTDKEKLVQRFQAGDLKAFEEIYDRYWLKLYNLAYAQIGTREEAEDLIHNLFENFWKKRNDTAGKSILQSTS
jgi:DNA-directed RNA polymerase specialized sigma24 family protein